MLLTSEVFVSGSSNDALTCALAGRTGMPSRSTTPKATLLGPTPRSVVMITTLNWGPPNATKVGAPLGDPDGTDEQAETRNIVKRKPALSIFMRLDGRRPATTRDPGRRRGSISCLNDRGIR